MARLRFLAGLAVAASSLWGFQESDGVRKAQAPADAMEIRAALAEQAHAHPDDITALTNYAEFLDGHVDPECRDAYRKLQAAAEKQGLTARAAAITRRLARLDLLAGDREAAAALEAYAQASGKPLSAGDASHPAPPWPTVQIPGPMRSFARMAAIPQDGSASDALPALARNIMTSGYETGRGGDMFEPTEYLKLLLRYLSQARELQALAGADKVIRIEKCESPAVADLLRVLGYRMRGGCGSEVVLETVNGARAFLTSDSGFPINALEQALRTDRPFTYDYAPSQVPVIFGADYWTAGSKESAGFVEALVGDMATCRLYLAFANLDRETASSLRAAVPLSRLKAYAHVLDFYGGMFEIRGGKAVTPGGARAAAAWGEMAGASTDQGPQFFDHLMAKDDGWLASLYDALARLHGPALDYLTEPARLKRFYEAVHGRVTTPGPARPVMRANADMMLLTTRLRIGPDGAPAIPGNLDIWRNVFSRGALGRMDVRLSKPAASWKEPDDLLEALFALCRRNGANQPLSVFMAASDIDRIRAKPLEPPVVERLIRDYPEFKAQYAVFSETPALSGSSMMAYLDAAAAISRTSGSLLRADSAGVFQALTGLWQILVRQGDIPEERADAAFAGAVGQFAKISGNQSLFDAGVKGLGTLLTAAEPQRANAREAARERPQEALLSLLAGAEGSATRTAMESALEAQRMLSLDTIYELAERLEAMAREKGDAAALAKPISAIAEIELPRPSLSNEEKLAQEVQSAVSAHLEAERGFHARTAIQRAGNDPARLREVRGMLTPWLRDTLVAFNYAYYAPPKAQVLYANPLYVRDHDFFGPQGADMLWWSAEAGDAGWPSNGGGRVMGSLAGLPYALAAAEQNFLVPTHTQALIWLDLAPQIIVSATLPRWDRVTADQEHWVGLNLRYAQELLAEAVVDAETRAAVLKAIGQLAAPAQRQAIAEALERGEAGEAARLLTPSEGFAVSRALAGTRTADDSAVAAQMRELARRAPREVSDAAISRAFGTPKPTLTNSYRPELLNLPTFPSLMGYSSRILAESWESNTLYWAALADELYVPPAELDVKIPEWTGSLVEHIFASNLDDWPAMLRSLRAVGADERARARQQQAELQGVADR